MIPFQKKRVELKQHGSFEVAVPGAEIELEFFSRIYRVSWLFLHCYVKPVEKSGLQRNSFYEDNKGKSFPKDPIDDSEGTGSSKSTKTRPRTNSRFDKLTFCRESHSGTFSAYWRILFFRVRD